MSACFFNQGRAPFPRFAAFLRSGPAGVVLRRTLAGFCAALLALTAVAAVPAEAGAPMRPAAKPPGTPATVKVGAVGYTEAATYFAKLGFTAVADEKARTLTLKSAEAELVLVEGSREARLDGMRVFLGEAVVARQGGVYVSTIDVERFLVPIIRPARFTPSPVKTIVIDAGHGGNDTGTQNKPGKFDEKVFTLDVAKRLQALLGEERWRVFMTRDDDRFVGLDERAAFANKAKADLFISIHFNAVANNADVRGTETYVLTPQHQRSTSSSAPSAADKVAQPGNAHDAWSAVLGHHMHRELLAKLKTEDRGYKRARFAVLRLVDCPAVLVEAGYLSNDAEANRLATPAYRADIADALHSAILAYDATLRAAAKED